jgi:hypothetical protein
VNAAAGGGLPRRRRLDDAAAGDDLIERVEEGGDVEDAVLRLSRAPSTRIAVCGSSVAIVRAASRPSVANGHLDVPDGDVRLVVPHQLEQLRRARGKADGLVTRATEPT